MARKINNVLVAIENAITQCEKYKTENIKLLQSAHKDAKCDYYRAIDYYNARVSGIKIAKEFIEKEYNIK